MWLQKSVINLQYNIPAWDDSAKLHVVSSSAFHTDQPCGPTWSIPQVGATDALWLCMETKQQMVFSY